MTGTQRTQLVVIVIGCAFCIGAALVEFRKESDSAVTTQEWQEFLTGRTSLTVDSEGNISYADSGGMTRTEFADALRRHKETHKKETP